MARGGERVGIGPRDPNVKDQPAGGEMGEERVVSERCAADRQPGERDGGSGDEGERGLAPAGQ